MIANYAILEFKHISLVVFWVNYFFKLYGGYTNGHKNEIIKLFLHYHNRKLG